MNTAQDGFEHSDKQADAYGMLLLRNNVLSAENKKAKLRINDLKGLVSDLDCDVHYWKNQAEKLATSGIQMCKNFEELELELAKAKLSNKGMHKTIERLTRYHSHKVSNNDTLRKHILTEGEAK